jgi:hypothetical protein
VVKREMRVAGKEAVGEELEGDIRDCAAAVLVSISAVLSVD